MHRVCLVLFVFAVALPVRAAKKTPKENSCQSLAPEALVSRVRETYRGRSLSAKFEQRYVDSVTGAKPSEHGQLALDARGRMRFAYVAPEEKVFVFDGQSAAFVEPDAKQVTVLDHFAESHAGAALALLTGRLSALDGIVLDRLATKEALRRACASERVLVFRPAEGVAGFARAEVEIDAARCEIATVRVIDAIGNASEYRLTERVLNASLPDALFVRRVPDGFDVLHVDAAPEGHASETTPKKSP